MLRTQSEGLGFFVVGCRSKEFGNKIVSLSRTRRGQADLGAPHHIEKSEKRDRRKITP
jgi:hypothetical protein